MSDLLTRLAHKRNANEKHRIESVPSPIKPGSIFTYCSCLQFHVVTHTGEENIQRAAVEAHRASVGVAKNRATAAILRPAGA